MKKWHDDIIYVWINDYFNSNFNVFIRVIQVKSRLEIK